MRAFHNIRRHCASKLVGTDFPRQETSGNTRPFGCKDPGGRTELDGTCSFGVGG